ncbi:hypothetical protein GCM10009678_92850 [Actinomadura kijaniata]
MWWPNWTASRTVDFDGTPTVSLWPFAYAGGGDPATSSTRNASGTSVMSAGAGRRAGPSTPERQAPTGSTVQPSMTATVAAADRCPLDGQPPITRVNSPAGYNT